jgi:hypothetical protein
MEGKVFAADDPIWKTWWPPNGFNCRCTTQPVDKWELAEGKYAIGDGSQVTLQPDPGFDFNVGMTGFGPIANETKGTK